MHVKPALPCRHLFTAIVLIMLSLGYSATALATAAADYDTGVKLFEQGKYQAAIARFESARKKGMESAALYFNLGSAYFKIENYADAKAYFERVAEYPEKRDLAEYDLGLIALKQNDEQQALRHFKYVAAMSENKKLVTASKQQIAALKEAEKPWRASFVFNLGYDDNINITPTDVAVGLSDTFYSLYASADYLVHGARKDGWLADASFFKLDFTDSGDFDQSLYTVGVRKEHQFSDWDTIVHLNAGRSTFGGEDLQSFYKLDVIGGTPLSRNQKIILEYRFDDFTSKNPLYDYLEGWRQRAQIRYYHYAEKSTRQLYYEAELNKRGELVTSLFSYEYSPTRHTFGGKYTQIFSSQWHLTGDLSYRISDFPASATVDRDDTRWVLGVLLDYRVDHTLTIKGNYKYIDNDSTFDIYTFDKSIVTIGLSKFF